MARAMQEMTAEETLHWMYRVYTLGECKPDAVDGVILVLVAYFKDREQFDGS